MNEEISAGVRGSSPGCIGSAGGRSVSGPSSSVGEGEVDGRDARNGDEAGDISVEIWLA